MSRNSYKRMYSNDFTGSEVMHDGTASIQHCSFNLVCVLNSVAVDYIYKYD